MTLLDNTFLFFIFSLSLGLTYRPLPSPLRYHSPLFSPPFHYHVFPTAKLPLECLTVPSRLRLFGVISGELHAWAIAVGSHYD